MESISDILKGRVEQPSVGGVPPHPFAFEVELVCKFLNEDNPKKWRGFLAGLPPFEIARIRRTCELEAKNKKSLFLFLVRDWREKANKPLTRRKKKKEKKLTKKEQIALLQPKLI